MPRGRPRKVVNQAPEQSEAASQNTSEQEVVQTAPEVSSVATQPVAKRSGRPARTPINGYRDVLKVDGQEPGWHYAWITDENTYRMEMGGYEFVSHDVVVGDRRINAASQIGSKVSIPGGNGVTLFLMRCPEEIYQEEMDLMHQRVDDNERAVFGKLNSKEDGRYGEVSIKRGKPQTY